MCTTTTSGRGGFARRAPESDNHFGVHESVASNVCQGRTHRRVITADGLPPSARQTRAAKGAEWKEI